MPNKVFSLRNPLSVHLRIAVFCGAILALSPLPSSAFDLTPPASTFEQERIKAAQQHDQVLAQFGGAYVDAELSAYVDRVGQKVAAASDLPDKPFNFTVLNTPVVNAFTVGGGYVYVTRGILASINSEAELAALLGHEIGHVTARHTARRETRMKQDKAVSIGVGLLTGSLRAALLTQGAGNVLRQAYSRDQEAESDKLGVISMAKAGYDPSAMPAMLGALNREVALMETMAGDQGGTALPSWLSDHPETEERVHDTTRQVSAMGSAPGDGIVGMDAHLDAIDGVLFGNDPRSGVFLNRSFIHPELEVAFDLPEGYGVQNMAGALIATRGEDDLVMFTAAQWPQERELGEFALSAWYSLTDGDLGKLDSVEKLTVNNLPAVLLTKRIQRRFVDVSLGSVAYRLDNGIVASLSMIVNGKLTETQLNGFREIAGSFHATSEAELDTIPNPRISVVTVTEGDTVDSLSARMLSRNFKKERFQALNGTKDTLETGQRVKLIVEGD